MHEFDEKGLAKSDESRKGGCILTYTGKIAYPLDPRPEEIDIYDIAHALAYIARYTGHTESFYSVAEHCVRASELVEDLVCRPHTEEHRMYAFEALMHDSSEAYLGDIAKPVKHDSYVGTLFGKAEDRLMLVIAEVFGFAYPKSEVVTKADRLMLRSEQRWLMPYPNELYSLEDVEMGGRIDTTWTPEEAEIEFIDRFKELTTNPPVGLATL